MRQEHVHTQALLDAKSKEINAETHLEKLTQRGLGRLQSELRALKKESEMAQTETTALQHETFAANEKLEKFKLQMNWNQDELLEWSSAIKQKEEDKDAIEQYHRQDSAKLTQLSQQVEKTSRALRESQTRLQEEITETLGVQMELDIIAETFKEEHRSRQDAIRRWHEAVQAGHQTDEDSLKKAEDLAKLMREVQELEVRERKLEEEHADAIKVFKQVQKEDLDLERALEKRRVMERERMREIEELKSTLATQQSQNEKAKLDLTAVENATRALRQKRDDHAAKIQDFKDLILATKQNLEAQTADKHNLEKLAGRIDELHRQHKERLEQLDKALQGSKESMFKHSHELFNLRKTEANLIAEISGAQGASRNLQARIRELDQRSLKQQEMLYSIEFQVQLLERKVSRSSGKRTFIETIHLNERIKELSNTLEETKAHANMLNNQLRRLQDDLRAARRTSDETDAVKLVLDSKLAAAQLEVDTEEREVKKCVTIKENLVVQHDEMNLEVKRLFDLHAAKKEKVFELEQRKLQLDLAMKEREKEISLHRDVQRAELKACEESRHQVVMELRERQIKLDRMKAKYDTVAGKLRGSSQGTDGEERSQAYYIIAAAQKREELQRESDELAATIKRLNKEIEMLEKTLNSLDARNKSFRESFHKADPQSQDMQLKAQLEQKQKLVADGLFKKKAVLRDLIAEFEDRKKTLTELYSTVEETAKEVKQQDQELALIQRKQTDEEQHLSRSIKTAQQRRAEYRKLHQLAKNETTPEELYVALQEIKRLNTLTLEELKQFSEADQSIADSVLDILNETGINLDKYTGGGSNGKSPRSEGKDDLPPSSNDPDSSSSTSGAFAPSSGGDNAGSASGWSGAPTNIPRPSSAANRGSAAGAAVPPVR